jgi:hypothetical protein
MLRGWFGGGSGRITPGDAERLLDGSRSLGGARPHGSRDSLADLLAAAASPAQPDELRGERAAVAGFRREFRSKATRSRARRPRRRAAVVGALTVAVLAVGGTAYAATTGHLPDAVQRAVDTMIPGDDASSVPAAPASSAAASGAGGLASSPPAPGGTASAAVPGAPGAPGAPGVDEKKLSGLCQSWQSTQDNPNAKAISAEDLRVLAAAAGGEDKIGAYCTALRGKEPKPGKSDKPGKPGKPKDH